MLYCNFNYMIGRLRLSFEIAVKSYIIIIEPWKSIKVRFGFGFRCPRNQRIQIKKLPTNNEGFWTCLSYFIKDQFFYKINKNNIAISMLYWIYYTWMNIILSSHFSPAGLMAAFLTFLLPETGGCELLETLEEAEEFYKTGEIPQRGTRGESWDNDAFERNENTTL